MRGTVLFVAALALTACASDPAVIGDRSAPKFQDDLRTCRQSSGKEVSLQEAKTFASWLASPFTNGGEMRRAVRGCMMGKGYAAR